jgi:hypothetical protein
MTGPTEAVRDRLRRDRRVRRGQRTARRQARIWQRLDEDLIGPDAMLRLLTIAGWQQAGVWHPRLQFAEFNVTGSRLGARRTVAGSRCSLTNPTSDL